AEPTSLYAPPFTSQFSVYPGEWDSQSWLSPQVVADTHVFSASLSKLRASALYFALRTQTETASRLFADRASGTTRTPYLGRSVIDASGTTGCASTSRNRYCCAIVASTSAVSISANVLPIHCLGPPPNGKYAKRGIRFSKSPSHRSGRNSSGASYHRASRCTVHCANETPEPFGTA